MSRIAAQRAGSGATCADSASTAHSHRSDSSNDGQSFVSRFSIRNSRFNRRGRHSSSRTRTIEKRFLGLFESSDGLFLGDSREIFQEFGERLSRLEIVDQRLERHTCAGERWCPAHSFRIDVDDGLLVHAEVILAVEGRLLDSTQKSFKARAYGMLCKRCRGQTRRRRRRRVADTPSGLPCDENARSEKRLSLRDVGRGCNTTLHSTRLQFRATLSR